MEVKIFRGKSEHYESKAPVLKMCNCGEIFQWINNASASKTDINTQNSIPWLKLTSFVDHGNLPHPWTTPMTSSLSSIYLLKVSLCFHREKNNNKKRKDKLEKNEYHLSYK